MRGNGLMWLGLLVFGMAHAGQMPLSATPTTSNPMAASHYASPVASGYYASPVASGHYANPEVRLQLNAHGTRYTGVVEYQGQVYPLEASWSRDGLQGQFYYQGQGHGFSAVPTAEGIRYETGGRAFSLARQATMEAPPSPSSPMEPPLTPVPKDQIALELKSMAREIRRDLQRFLQALQQWLDQNLPEDQAVQLLEQHLLPQSLTLNTTLEQLARLASQGRAELGLSSSEQQVLGRLAVLTHKGARFFQDWYSLLNQLDQRYRAGQRESLQQMASEHLPQAVRGSVGFSRQYVRLVALVEKIKTIRTAHGGDPIALNPASLLKWQTLNNMSDTMRQGLDVFQDLRGDTMRQGLDVFQDLRKETRE